VAPADAPLVAVVGPTASGKSALALRLALETGGEIVSCDSQQVYVGLDIGTAKPSPDERRQVPHHLLDVADPARSFSAADYARLARAAVASIAARSRLPIVAGGSGLYLRALLQGLFAGPSRDIPLRLRLEAIAVRHGDLRLHRLLQRVDPAAAGRIEPRDRVRVVRALEVYRATGKAISEQQLGGGAALQGFDALDVGLSPPRETLRHAVVARTRAMLEAGLVEEVRGLLARGLPADSRALQSIGYRQAVAVVRGELSAAAAERSIVTDTMRLAKRQLTWFRHQQPDTAWFEGEWAAHAAVLSWLEGRRRGAGANPTEGLASS
jgi:tRNA dimethylallyltransferase